MDLGEARHKSKLATAPILVVKNGRLQCGELHVACAIGRGGIRADKCEGDGATPAGRFPLRYLLFRPDRLDRVATGLPTRKLQPADGWCDDPLDPCYNRLVQLPYPGRHEVLWRADALYDLIVVVGYNDAPVVPGRGSAIFLHNARPDFAATDGCVALAQADLVAVVGLADAATTIEIVS